MECKICLSSFTKDLRKEVCCPYCTTSICVQCMKTVLLESPRDPKCANCSKGLTPEFLDTTFSKGFRRGELRKRQIECLLDLEKSLLPQASEILRRRKQDIQYAVLVSEIRILCSRMLSTLVLDPSLERLLENAREVRPSDQPQTEKLVRTVKCPKCRGYINISKTGTCDLCSYKLCRTCGNESKDTHVCADDDVQSFQYMKDNFKACPKCGIFIAKVSGCNQMFCVSCHTAFDWSSLRITSGPIHNPHYFEFLRTRDTDLVATACDGAYGRDLFPATFFETVCRGHPCYNRTGIHVGCARDDCWTKNHFTALWQAGNWVLADARLDPEDYTENVYLEYRLRYLDGRISEAQWKSKLSFRETLRLKRNRILEITKMFATVLQDLGQRLFATKDFQEFFKAAEELRVYVLNAKLAVYQDFSDKTFQHYNSDWERVAVRV